MIKVAAPNMAQRVCDIAIQVIFHAQVILHSVVYNSFVYFSSIHVPTRRAFITTTI